MVDVVPRTAEHYGRARQRKTWRGSVRLQRTCQRLNGSLYSVQVLTIAQVA